MSENIEIKRAARAAKIPLWRVANEIGVSEATMTRWLRTPLPIEKERRVLDAIARLTQ